MKKARKVVIPEDRILSVDEYKDFSSHALNSSLYYLSNYSRNTNQLIDKLLDKGYIRDNVLVKSIDGTVEEFNIIDDTIKKLEDMLMIDDEYYARSLIESKIRRGYGLNRIKRDLFVKKVDSSLIEKLLPEYEDESRGKIEDVFNKIVNSPSFKRLDDVFKKKQKVYTTLLGKGFNYADINDIMNNFEDC